MGKKIQDTRDAHQFGAGSGSSLRFGHQQFFVGKIICEAIAIRRRGEEPDVCRTAPVNFDFRDFCMTQAILLRHFAKELLFSLVDERHFAEEFRTWNRR